MRTIRPLSKPALAVFHALTEGITAVGDHRKYDNGGAGIMPVCVTAVDYTPNGQLIVSIAHYYEQNFDLMADPDVKFVVSREDYVFPISYRQDGLGMTREYVRWEGDRVYWNLRAQNDLASFCTGWMRNIKEQQFGGKLPKPVAAA